MYHILLRYQNVYDTEEIYHTSYVKVDDKGYKHILPQLNETLEAGYILCQTPFEFVEIDEDNQRPVREAAILIMDGEVITEVPKG